MRKLGAAPDRNWERVAAPVGPRVTDHDFRPDPQHPDVDECAYGDGTYPFCGFPADEHGLPEVPPIHYGED